MVTKTTILFLIFHRLVEEDERKWTDENVDFVALKHFPNIDKQAALGRPILYSNWLSKDYIPVDREELRDFVKARLKVRNWNLVPSLMDVRKRWS